MRSVGTTRNRWRTGEAGFTPPELVGRLGVPGLPPPPGRGSGGAPAGPLGAGGGEPIHLVRDARGVRLVSAGPDGQPGTADDLTLALDQELRGTLTGLLLDGRARPRAGSVGLVGAQRGLPARREAQAEANGRFVFAGGPIGRHPPAAVGQGGGATREG